jgi:large subunit ribosomal protein L25
MPQELQFEVRSEKGTRRVKRLRAKGKIPAVVYGEGKPAEKISIDERVFSRMFFAGERVVILKSDGKDTQALIKDIQYDALGEHMLHVDFHKLKAGQKVSVKISIAVTGTPKGAVDEGVLNQNLHEIEVECLPTAIPEKVTVDVSPLEIGQAIHVSEMVWPEGVTPKAEPDVVVATCDEPRKIEEPAEPAEGEAREPEVLSEKKDEDGKAGDEDEKKDEDKEKK